MIVKVISIIKEISGKVSDDLYCRMKNGKQEVCRMPKRRKRRRRDGCNSAFAEAIKVAKVRIKEPEFREEATRRWREWNAQFPENWQPARTAAERKRERHPYATVFQFVVGELMRERKG